jgi:hypothetical protein
MTEKFKYIRKVKQHYEVVIEYNKQKYYASVETLEKAKEKLIDFQSQIEEIKKKRIEDIYKMEITRDIEGNAIIPLKNIKGEIVDYSIVDDDVWHKCMEYKWHKTPQDYAQGIVDKVLMKLHQFILGKSENTMIIDHSNRKKLDNRRSNLRFSTFSQNSQNRNKQIGTKNKYIGISFRDDNKKWEVHSSGKYLGCFENELNAAKHYDTFVLLKHGETAKTNNLVKYEDIKDININDLFPNKNKRDLPKFICMNKSKYQIVIIYKKQKFYAIKDTLEEAIKKLNEFQSEINEIKRKEIEDHYNREIIRNENGIAVIYVKNNKGEKIDEFTVSDDRWHDCMNYYWCSLNDGYFAAHINGKSVRIHRYIMDAQPNQTIDHIDHDTKNNQTSNLRVSDGSSNGHNRTKKSNTTSIYYGVHLQNTTNNWIARVGQNSKRIHIGSYKTEVEAAIAYNIKAQELYGNHANLNKISDEDYKKYMPEEPELDDIPEIDYDDTL